MPSKGKNNMKYEYEEVILQELVNHFKDDINFDKSSLEQATIDVTYYDCGTYKSSIKNDNNLVPITIVNGMIEGITDSHNSEYSINFTIYVIHNENVHKFCKLDVN
jgi:hypothetical protein